MSRRRLLLTSVLLGTLVVGPLVSCVVGMPREIVNLRLIAGYVAFGMLLSGVGSLMVAGMITGFVSGVVCARVGYEPRRAALRAARAMLLLTVLLSLPLYLPDWRHSFAPRTLLGTAVALALCGFAAAVTGYFTALLTNWWEEQWQPPEPPDLSTSQPRPTRYRI